MVYKHHDVFILGQLESSGYEPVLNVSIMPWSTKNLAPSVWHKVGKAQSGASSRVQDFVATARDCASLGIFPKYYSHDPATDGMLRSVWRLGRRRGKEYPETTV